MLRLLSPLHSAAGIEELFATVLRSAWEGGGEGKEALLDETVALLNMQPLPRTGPDPQQAFNLLPEESEEETALGVESVLGLPPGVVRCSGVRTPVFHGLAASIWVRTAKPLGERAAEDLLERAVGVEIASGESLTPVGAAESPAVRACRPVRQADGLLLWGAADPSTAGAAAEAIRLAATILGGGTSEEEVM
jgi:aspartate-semialdehyde dehydrogenase